MSDLTWRPLGVDTDEAISGYDALHDGVPPWMEAAFWAWIMDSITVKRWFSDRSGQVAMVDTTLTEEMCQRLRIFLPDMRSDRVGYDIGHDQLHTAREILGRHTDPLQLADYLLAHNGHASSDELELLLERSKSAWTVGTRAGRPGLVRRVPIGVQIAAEAVMGRAGTAGSRLAKAWEALYGLVPDPSAAYRLAIQAVEDAAVPVVSPQNARATLGTVIEQIKAQKNWKLPMAREHQNGASGDVLIAMMRMLWHGQHARHGGQPSAPGNVSTEEATVAVATAVTLVHWFDAGLVLRQP